MRQFKKLPGRESDLVKEMYEVHVNGAVMVHGPGHLTAEKSAEWVEIYRKINPNLPADSIFTKNTYR